MFLVLNFLSRVFYRYWRAAMGCAAVGALLPISAFADAPSLYSSYALQQALATSDHFNLYAPHDKNGLNIGGSTFSSPVPGATTPESVASLNDNQKLYALLIDGRYDFNYEASGLSSSLHPYVSGGMGVASANNLDSQGGSTVPLFRLGGGVAYRLDAQWNLSLDYKEGVAAPTPSDQLFTGRSPQPVDMHALNLGMSYLF